MSDPTVDRSANMGYERIQVLFFGYDTVFFYYLITYFLRQAQHKIHQTQEKITGLWPTTDEDERAS